MLDTREVFAGISADWIVPHDLPYFDGHFPGNPVFPAVGIVDASLALLRKQTGRDLQLAGIGSAKFTQPIGPGTAVHIDLNLKGADWVAEWSSAGKKVATISLQVVGA
jgi:3-hydroxyacyl-[acyl-carrier-protein] dehydratase